MPGVATGGFSDELYGLTAIVSNWAVGIEPFVVTKMIPHRKSLSFAKHDYCIARNSDQTVKRHFRTAENLISGETVPCF